MSDPDKPPALSRLPIRPRGDLSSRPASPALRPSALPPPSPRALSPSTPVLSHRSSLQSSLPTPRRASPRLSLSSGDSRDSSPSGALRFGSPRPPSMTSHRTDSASPHSRRRSHLASEYHDLPVTVNVSVRLKPVLSVESLLRSPGAVRVAVEQVSNTAVAVTPTTSALSQATSPIVKKYVFDRVFSQATSQSQIFEHLKMCVPSFVQGYNVTVMAYGQSGSGKTYTMGTSESPASIDDLNSAGIIARAARNLFEELILSQNPTVTVSYMEIYNEQLRDLLAPSSNSSKALTIREEAKGNVGVQGLTQIPVDGTDELLHLLHRGSTVRQTDSTAINERSSRSHAIFTIHLVQTRVDPVTGISSSIKSKLNFVDLAGSERLKNIGSGDNRIKESISINSGLTTLGKVISQLSTSTHGGHISYRDSKLTRVLQDSLGGRAITYLIACVTVDSISLTETLSTLSYAQRARSIQIMPEIQQTQSKDELLRTIAHLQRELATMKANFGLEATDPVPMTPTRASIDERTMSGLVTDHGSSEEYDSASVSDIQSVSTPPLLSPSAVRSDGTATGFPPELLQYRLPTHSLSKDTLTSKERLLRSEELHDNIQLMIQDYEKTAEVLQASISDLKEENRTLLESLALRDRQVVQLEQCQSDLQGYVHTLEDHLGLDALEDREKELRERIQDELSGFEAIPPNKSLISTLENEIRGLRALVASYKKAKRQDLAESQYLIKRYKETRRELEKLKAGKMSAEPEGREDSETSLPDKSITVQETPENTEVATKWPFFFQAGVV